MIKEKIQDDIKNAMRNKEKLTLSVLRMVLAEFKMLETSGQENITEKDYLSKVEAYAKKLKKSLESFTGEKHEVILQEIAIVENYLPKKATQDEHQALIDANSGMAVNDIRKKIMEQLGDSCDKALLNQLLTTK